MDKNSPWNYFIRLQNGSAGQCKQCSKTIKTSGGSTSGLHAHLRTQHKIILLKRDKDIANEPGTSTTINTSRNVNLPTISNFFVKSVDDSFPAVVARLTAKYGLPFVKFCTSYDLRKLLHAKGYTIPKSPNTIRKIVSEYAAKMRQRVFADLKTRTDEGIAFSLTLDEWTSVKNRRYMNVNVHTFDKFWNLGLVRILGSMPADKCVALLEKKFKEFGISFDNVVAITTDGASVMKKVGTLISANHQLCIVHGIQLAIIKILYDKDYSAESSGEQEEATSPESLSDDDDDVDGLELISETDVDPVIQHANIRPLIEKIRKVVKIFRLSPTKNDAILQKNIKAELSKELSLTLDTRTRWSSLLAMLERFYEIRNAIRKSLIDIESAITFDEKDISLLSNVIAALQPLKVAVEALCCEDVNLYTADITLEFMLNELTQQNTILSNELKDELILRIKERRTINSDVLSFLHDPNKLNCKNNTNYGVFYRTSKAAITKTIIKIIERVSNNKQDENIVSDNDDHENDVVEVVEVDVASASSTLTAVSNISLKEKLQLEIIKKTRNPEKDHKNKNSNDLGVIVKREITYFQHENIRNKYLNIAFDHLMTIRPTSVESERAFSAAGLISTKIRSQLSDRCIDDLCFLRSYFKNDNSLKINSVNENSN